MASLGKIDLQHWMAADSTHAVLRALTADGAEVRFVGGCVRDALLGLTVKDIDIATHDRPEVVIELLRRAGIKAIPTGIDHGTITAVVSGDHFEITTLRLDVETYGRRAKVAFTDDWVADAARRDFTINALSAAPDGTLFDPFDGRADLEAGRVRFVGDARERLREDVLRLLRFFRFHAYYGKSSPDPDALDACTEMAPRLVSLSPERVRTELIRLLLAPDPATILALMADRGVLQHILPEAQRFDRLRRLVAIEVARSEAADAVRRLAAVLAVNADTARQIAMRLRFSNAERERLVGLTGMPQGLAFGDDDPVQRHALYRLGAARYRDLLLMAAAESGESTLLDRCLETTAAWQAPALPVAGADVLRLGVASGPEVGRILSAVEDWWVAGDFQAGRDACMARLKELIDERE